MKYGSIHGRFQPFHNGHLEYLQAAVERCDYLFVGITQHVVKRLVQVSSSDAVHRAEPQSNPLTYYERKLTVDAVLGDLGVGPGRYCVLPFPIEEPNQLREFLPTSVPVFTTTYDKWNETKIGILEGLGYRVENLWTRTQKDVTGRNIRSMIKHEDQAWRELVPPSVGALIDEFDVASRLQALAPDGT